MSWAATIKELAMITDEELDQIIADHHEFFPERTLEQIANGYAQRAEDERRAGKDEAAERYDNIAAALYERISRQGSTP